MHPAATTTASRRAPILHDRLAAARSRASARAWPAFVVAVLVAAVAVRFLDAGALWFDEAQSVAIARLPPAEMLTALRRDGSPPLYYLLLHGWMAAFGETAVAVRALSGALAAAALAPAWRLARRLLPEHAALPALVLVATSPLAIRYASEARMYSLELLLIALAGLALVDTLESARRRSAALLVLASGLLLLTHYWALFLLAAVSAGLLPGALRGDRGQRRALTGALGGCVLLAPWLPAMAFQLRHTGTPWGHSGWQRAFEALPVWAGASQPLPGLPFPPAGLLVPLFAGLAVLGAVKLPVARRLAVLAGGTMALAGAVSVALGSAIVPRYMTIGLLPYLFAVAGGLAALARPRRRTLLVAAAMLGLATGFMYARAPRTVAPAVAAALRRWGQPTDVVVYCPDQLGPDTSRLLPGWHRQQLYPTGAAPARVDWIDYSRRNRRSQPAAYARRVAGQAGDGAVWLYEGRGFQSFHGSCARLAAALARLRPYARVRLRGHNPMDSGERLRLIEYAPR